MLLEEYDIKKVTLLLAGLLLVLGAIIGGGAGIYYFSKYRNAEKRLSDANDARLLIDKVGKLIKLPEGEIPTVATISNLERLKAQPFFARAKVGDRLLIFNQAKKAVLYDPVENKIVEVGPLIIPTPTIGGQTAGANSEQIEKISLSFYTGFKDADAGNLKEIRERIEGEFPEISISNKITRSTLEFAKTLVVDLTGNKSEITQKIADSLGAEVSALPDAIQPAQDIDILVILGKNQENF